MTKKNVKNSKKTQSRIFKIGIGIILTAFIILILSDLFSKKRTDPVIQTSQNQNVYQFEKHGELSFQSSKGDFISSLDIEFAENDFERTQGMKYRTSMEENQGMLFIFPYERIQSFWMKSTVISLDMIFINSKMKIVTIHKNTIPYDESSYASTEPAQYVLETIAGYVDKYNVKVGDKVIFRKTN